MSTGVPKIWKYMMKGVLSPLQPVLRYMIPTLRSVDEAAVDLIEISVGKAHAGETGFYTMLKKDTSSPESYDEEKQKQLWAKSLAWAELTRDQTALSTAFD
jgi:hypothetical protein